MSASKQKGTAFETLVVNYLREHGFPHAERRTLSGAHDKGDISGVIGWALECKNRKTLDLSGAVDEAKKEGTNAKARWYAAIIKRPRKGSAADAYVVMPLEVFVDLIREDLS